MSPQVLILFALAISVVFPAIAQEDADAICARILALDREISGFVRQYADDVAAGKRPDNLPFGVPAEKSEVHSAELRKLEALGDTGNARANHLAGVYYFDRGTGVVRREGRTSSNQATIEYFFKHAEPRFRAAASSGYPFSMPLLGMMYQNGYGVY
jgi:TPR repeat protein